MATARQESSGTPCEFIRRFFEYFTDHHILLTPSSGMARSERVYNWCAGRRHGKLSVYAHPRCWQEQLGWGRDCSCDICVRTVCHDGRVESVVTACWLLKRRAKRGITKGCTRSTHSGGCEVVRCLFVPGEPRRYPAKDVLWLSHKKKS